ncbi:MAG TPA: PEP-CTERM sorting domain-containing protein [Myxococcota bacterium]|jgi:hypothetical protein|nr:PEP-CTERM sorting domain-containing protein [Myxococcota bacterium]
MAAPQPLDQTWFLHVPLAIGFETALDTRFTISAQFTMPAPIGITCNLSTDVACHDAGEAIVDLSHTGLFESATILDALGNPASGVSLQSASGFDYLHPVPEPGSLALVGSGILGLRATCRRRRPRPPTSTAPGHVENPR